ncbi:MAG: hypothetical protein H0X50_09950 [Nitrosopumilus sp.]|nr:hypothetical protein [Nitrosopumilus sp.]
MPVSTPPSSSVRSFRMDKAFSEILYNEADRMGISVNAMMNSILKQYTEFTRFQSKLDMIVINREIFTSILKCIEENQAFDLGLEMGIELPNDTILFWKKHVSMDSVIEYIEKILCTYGRIGTYDEINEANKKIIVIRHRLGFKGSKFLLGYIKSLFKNMLEMDCEIQITDHSIKVQLDIITE